MNADEIRAKWNDSLPDVHYNITAQVLVELAAQLATLNQIAEAILVELQRRNGV